MTRALPAMNASTAALNPHVAATSAAVAQGRTAKRAGTAYEEVVAAELEALQRGGTVADFARVDARKVESAGRILARIAGACDFHGILSTGARGFAIEVKSTRAGDVWLAPECAAVAGRTRDPALSLLQRAQLTRYARAGGVALLALRVGRSAEVVDWRDVRHDAEGRLTWARGYASVAEALRALSGDAAESAAAKAIGGNLRGGGA